MTPAEFERQTRSVVATVNALRRGLLDLRLQCPLDADDALGLIDAAERDMIDTQASIHAAIRKLRTTVIDVFDRSQMPAGARWSDTDGRWYEANDSGVR